MATTLKLARLDGGPEIFHTLQGEGVSVGVPAVFVRLSLCNLHCTWCDTDYTWNWKGTPFTHENDALPGYEKFDKEDQLIEMSVSEVADEVVKFPCRRVVLTGGEPLLQMEGLEHLIDELRARDGDYFFEIETNGTRVPSSCILDRVNQFNVSPKLENSGNKQTLRIQRDALEFFANCEAAWFKFVVARESDFDEIRALVGEFNIPRSRVLLMPEGRSVEAIHTHRELVIDACLREGFRFSDRLHLRLFGAKRGT